MTDTTTTALSNIKEAGIPTSTITAAISHCADLIRSAKDPIARAGQLISELLEIDIHDLPFTFTDEHTARITALAVVQTMIEMQDKPVDKDAIVAATVARSQVLRSLPQLQYIFTTKPVTVVGGQVIDEDGQPVRQRVKGGRQDAAYALWTSHVLKGTPPMSRKDFVALLVKDLQLTENGAKTYAYNCSTKLGVPEGMEKAKRVKSDGGSAKQPRVDALYKEHYLDAATPMKRDDLKALIAKEVSTTLQGANTYLYNASKTLGKRADEVATTRGRKSEGPSKQSRAVDLYIEHVRDAKKPLEKADMIKELAKQLETSKLGAQSFYYGAMKILRDKGELEAAKHVDTKEATKAPKKASTKKAAAKAEAEPAAPKAKKTKKA